MFGCNKETWQNKRDVTRYTWKWINNINYFSSEYFNHFMHHDPAGICLNRQLREWSFLEQFRILILTIRKLRMAARIVPSRFLPVEMFGCLRDKRKWKWMRKGHSCLSVVTTLWGVLSLLTDCMFIQPLILERSKKLENVMVERENREVFRFPNIFLHSPVSRNVVITNFSINWNWQFNSIKSAPTVRCRRARKGCFINISLGELFLFLHPDRMRVSKSRVATAKSNSETFSTQFSVN